jgi:hypothetical protein
MLDRRDFLSTVATAAAGLASGCAANAPARRPLVTGIYGGFLNQILERGQKPDDYGINAVWVGSGGLKADQIARHKDLGLKVYAEFNSMHLASFLRNHPDAAPIGRDGRPSPAPSGWQGVSAHHAGYRRDRMQEFRRVLETYDIDGIWLDYHHAHAAWEQAEPDLPDTDFCPEALRGFTQTTGIQIPVDPAQAAACLLGEHREGWTAYRCAVFTDWVREYREILNATRPRALLGTFHCPWGEDERDGAIRHKLAIDLRAQAPYLDVFSIMPYHARFGHAGDPAWISRQTAKLGKLLGLRGEPGEKKFIWPIVQSSDWGERVPVSEIPEIIRHGLKAPATGVMTFAWSGIAKEWPKVDAIGQTYRKVRP